MRPSTYIPGAAERSKQPFHHSLLPAQHAPNERHAFHLVVDDGGRPYLNDGSTRRHLGMTNYELLRELAAEFGTCIPIAYTFRYLDASNVSGLGGSLPYANELAAFIREHLNLLPMLHHGLTHGYTFDRGKATWPLTHAEFFDLDHGRPIAEADQAWALEMSARICDDQQFPRPTVFVPPCHAWEPGVTDRLVRGCGMHSLIGVPRLTFQSRRYDRATSDYVEMLPRKSLAISHKMTEAALDKARLKAALAEVVPMGLRTRLRYYRRITNPRVHSYYAHITNFFPGTREFWLRFFDALLRRGDLTLATSEEHAAQMYFGEVSP